jgi:ribonucleotide monophosphatase NagD (HAD superfamily)
MTKNKVSEIEEVNHKPELSRASTSVYSGVTSNAPFRELTELERAMGRPLTPEQNNKVLQCMEILTLTVEKLNSLRNAMKDVCFVDDNDGVRAGTTEQEKELSRAFTYLMKNMLTENGPIPFAINTNDSRVFEHEKNGSLVKQGFDYEASQIVLCSRATAKALFIELEKQGKGKNVAVFGTPQLVEICKQEGLNPVDPKKEKVDAVISGEIVAPNERTKAEIDEIIKIARQKGVLVAVTNSDKAMPYTDKVTGEKIFVKCIGSDVLPAMEKICNKMGKSLIMGGKPSPDMLKTGLEQACKSVNRDPATIRTVFSLGDTSYCDFLMGNKSKDLFEGKQVISIGTLMGNMKSGDVTKLPKDELPRFVIENFRELPDIVIAVGESKHLFTEQEKEINKVLSQKEEKNKSLISKLTQNVCCTGKNGMTKE